MTKVGVSASERAHPVDIGLKPGKRTSVTSIICVVRLPYHLAFKTNEKFPLTAKGNRTINI